MSVVHRKALQLLVQIIELFILRSGFFLSGFLDFDGAFRTGQKNGFFAIAVPGHLVLTAGRVAVVVLPVINVLLVLVRAFFMRFGNDAAKEKIFEFRVLLVRLACHG